MAGTTVNEKNVVYKTLQKAINEAGFNFTLDQVLEHAAGNEKLQAIKNVLSASMNLYDDALAVAIYDNFIIQLEIAYRTLDIREQKNATELFAALKNRNIITVLNTGYNRKTAESILSKLGWKEGREIDLLVTATDVQTGRPSPAMILFAMSKFAITDAAEVVKVGDSIIDIQEGDNAGCSLSVGITTGAHTYAQLHSASPAYIINNLIELLPLLG